MKVLVVTSPFGDYRRGDTISDPEAMEAILAGGHAQHVVPSDRDIPTKPAKPSKPQE